MESEGWMGEREGVESERWRVKSEGWMGESEGVESERRMGESESFTYAKAKILLCVIPHQCYP